MKNYKPDYEHIRCKCGGVIASYNRDTFNCEICFKEFKLYELDYDRCLINITTGWVFPVKDRKNEGEKKMKVYSRNFNDTYDYPEDMKKILDYLNDHGKILVSGRCIEMLYREFSNEHYCAGWMIVDERMLEEFEDWLNRYDR